MTNSDVRETLVAEIRGLNEKVEAIRDEIEDKQRAKLRLKSTSGLQARIEMMKENCNSDAKALHESIEGKLDALKSFEIEVPDDLPNDPTIVTPVQEIADSIDLMYQSLKRKAAKGTEKLEKAKQSQVQQSATFSTLTSTLASLEKRRDVLLQDNQSVGKVKRVVSEMSQAGAQMDWNIENEEPHKLVEMLDKSIKELEEAAPGSIPPNDLVKVLKQIKALGKNNNECPCCKRAFSGNEKKVFTTGIRDLGDKTNSPLLNSDPAEMELYQARISQLKKWREEVFSCMSDLNEYHRIVADITDKKPAILHGEGVLKALNADVEKLESEVSAENRKEETLRDILSHSKRWREQASRIEVRVCCC